MTNTVIFNGSGVHDAIQWCDKEIGITNYELNNMFPSFNWLFKFQKPEHATHFALKWL